MKRIRVIVCPHELVMGGSQINAIELAGKLKQRGHDVVVFAPPGQLSGRVAELGLELVASPDGTRMSWGWMRELGRLAKDWKADIVHTYEWAPSLGAAWRLLPFTGTRVVMTVLSMDVPDFLPKHVPLIVGTKALHHQSGRRSAPVHLMEPPIDTEQNSHGALPSSQIKHDGLVISMVCRITDELDKAEGILQAIYAVAGLSRDRRLQLIIAGDGEAMQKIRVATREVNEQFDREVVRLVGTLFDPRAVYDQSDISLGMGSSALKALSFAKPLIVQGSGGYWKTLTPETLTEFEWQGFYGQGGGGAEALATCLARLCDDAPLRERLGIWGRSLVEEKYSLRNATVSLERIYFQTLAANTRRGVGSACMTRSAYDFGKFLLAKRIRSGVSP
ncbi:glycosyltransferase family 4 protein [Paeniglutamicibacter sp.]|uniref:glycosyltransferase family 4 protein n=1 Tax=Paeniglutamicibacter sp. TaxID=1934391 RepID=UPI0039895408